MHRFVTHSPDEMRVFFEQRNESACVRVHEKWKKHRTSNQNRKNELVQLIFKKNLQVAITFLTTQTVLNTCLYLSRSVLQFHEFFVQSSADFELN